MKAKKPSGPDQRHGIVSWVKLKRKAGGGYRYRSRCRRYLLSPILPKYALYGPDTDGRCTRWLGAYYTKEAASQYLFTRGVRAE